MNHSQVTLACLLMNVSFIALAYAGRAVGSTILLCAMIGCSYALIAVLKHWKRRPVLVVATSGRGKASEKGTKIVAFNTEEAAVAEQ
jgi:hypothetical protein